MNRRRALAGALGVQPLRALVSRLPLWRGLLVLAYHRIGDGSTSRFDRGVWSATEEGFDAQLRFLRRHADVIAPTGLAAALDGGAGRRVLITFDDGYRDNHARALPLLCAHDLRAAFFVATGFLDDPRVPWWDEIAWMVRQSPERSIVAEPFIERPLALGDGRAEAAIRSLSTLYKSLPEQRAQALLDTLAEATRSGRWHGDASERWMTWDMVRELQGAGMTIGGHTVEHPVLSRVDTERKRAEVSRCADRLEAELGVDMTMFSYPVGLPDSFGSTAKAALRERGVRHAFSLYGGYARPGHADPLDIPRTSVGAATRQADLRAVTALPFLFARE